MQGLFTNTFPLDGKIKLRMAGVHKNGRKKKDFHEPENQFPRAGIRLFFKNWISASRKNLQIKKTV